MDQEMMEEVKKQMTSIFEGVLAAMPTIAKIYKSLYDNLQKEGFTKEEAMRIVTNYNLNNNK